MFRALNHHRRVLTAFLLKESVLNKLTKQNGWGKGGQELFSCVLKNMSKKLSSASSPLLTVCVVKQEGRTSEEELYLDLPIT